MTRAAPKARRIRKEKPHRGDDRAKVAWLHTRECIASPTNRTNRIVHAARGPMPDWSGCDGRIEVHHDRPGGARATDKRTAPVCTGHHRTGPDSLATLGRRGFEQLHSISMNAETARYEREWQVYRSQGEF